MPETVTKTLADASVFILKKLLQMPQLITTLATTECIFFLKVPTSKYLAPIKNWGSVLHRYGSGHTQPELRASPKPEYRSTLVKE